MRVVASRTVSCGGVHGRACVYGDMFDVGTRTFSVDEFAGHLHVVAAAAAATDSACIPSSMSNVPDWTPTLLMTCTPPPSVPLIESRSVSRKRRRRRHCRHRR